MTDKSMPDQIWAYQENNHWTSSGWSPEPITYGGAQKYVRGDLYDETVERAEKAEVERDALAKAIKRVQKIRRDLDDFDGDKRGHLAALDDAEEKAARLANAVKDMSLVGMMRSACVTILQDEIDIE